MERSEREALFDEKWIPEPTSGCWLWIAYCNPSGYPRFWAGAGPVLAHRWNYERHVGPIPQGMTLDHKCETTTCVNPAHLRPMTSSENARRRTRTVKFYELDGERINETEMCRRLGMHRMTFRSRLRRGWDIEEATGIAS